MIIVYMRVSSDEQRENQSIELQRQEMMAFCADRKSQNVVIIEDDEVGIERQVFGLAAQQAGADGMEGAQPETLRGQFAEHAPHAVVHLAGGLVGEGDRQHLPGTDALPGDEPGDALGEHAGLAGTGACQDEHRT